MGANSGVTWNSATQAFSYSAGSQYAQFVANYGWPAVAPGKWGPQFGVTSAGTPFVTCTTCHNQHVMTVYSSSTNSPIAGDGGGKFYTTYFFVNGPYNPNLQTYAKGSAPSTTQFCRQCHFGESNEGNNTTNITTQFQ